MTYLLNISNEAPVTYTGTSAVGAICNAGATCITGEDFPTNARTMNFRVTVRDGKGGNADAGMSVTVINTLGVFPFAVASDNTATSFQGGANRVVIWNISGTTRPPINTANVRISLSTDGGQTFPTILAASTPNDGSESVFIPNTPTTTGRIKIEAVGNIFFDINDANITINATPTAARVSVSGRVTTADGRGIRNVSVTLTDANGNSRSALSSTFGYYRFADVAAGATYVIAARAKRFTFAEPTQILNVVEDAEDVNFIADPN